MDIGAQLRHAREARGLTIDAVSRSTRVQPRILAAIEQNDPAPLPPRPYGRGFVRSYASEVGLDADLVVREFFSQFAPPPDAQPPTKREPVVPVLEPPTRGWLWTSALVLTYTVIGAIVIAAGRWAMQPRVEQGAVGTAGLTSSAPAPQTVATDAAVAKAAAPPAGVRVNLQAERPVWVTAVVDGDRQVYRILQPGERVSLNGAREVSVRVGDAGAVLWQVNDQPAAPMGHSGEVRTERVTIGHRSPQR